MNPEVEKLTDLVKTEGAFIHNVKAESAKTIIGQNHMVERILMGLLTGGHVLLEGLPGLAKTLTVNTIATILDVKFSRVQFTPDLLPSDLTGTMIYNQKSGDFTPKKGPIFANIVLADEINRAPAKVQSALLECMAEKQVTIGNESYKLDEPFLVLATQNPIEQEGTYALPEAQMDRFMFKVNVGYPNRIEELRILETQSGKSSVSLQNLASSAQLLKAKSICENIFLDEKIKKYIIDIVFASRKTEHNPTFKEIRNYISIGGSPRATLFLAKASRAKAFLDNRGYVTPDDVKSVALDVLRHRIILNFEAESEGIKTDDLVKRILSVVTAP